MEGGGSDYKLSLHRLHHLPRLPPWFLGKSWYGDRQTQGQTDPEGYRHEVLVPPRYLPGPAQVVRRLGQVQVSGCPGGIWRGAQVPPLLPKVFR